MIKILVFAFFLTISVNGARGEGLEEKIPNHVYESF